MAEWGSNPVKKINLNKKEFGELIKSIESIGTERKKLNPETSEADFLCGAMAAMERLGIRCTTWPLQIMSGIKILGE